jgi:hypothetical protein
MRSTTRELTDEIYTAINEALQWRHVRNQRTEPLALRSITRKFARTSRLSNIVTIALGLAIPVAYGMGFFVISAYLINTGAPLPISDFSTTLWFISLAGGLSRCPRFINIWGRPGSRAGARVLREA